MEPRPPQSLPQVTDRQLEVARLIAEGYGNPRIAEELGITLAGAKYHVFQLLMRLGLERREEIAAWYRDQHRCRPQVQALFALKFGAAVGAASAIAVAVLVVALVANARNNEPQPVDAPPAATGQLLAPPAPTEQVDPDDAARDAARRTLAAIPGVSQVVDAVERGDVDALMPLFLRRETWCFSQRDLVGDPCVGDGCLGARHDLCVVAGVGEDELVETIWMRVDGPFDGSTFRFPGFISLSIGNDWLDPELRPVLEAMLGNRGGRLEFAVRRRFFFTDLDGNLSSEDWVQLGFSTGVIDGTPLGAFSEGETVVLNGLGLFVNTAGHPPIARFILLGPGEGGEARPHLPASLPDFALGAPPPERLPADSPEAAAVRAELEAVPALRAVIGAAESGDADALIALMRTEVVECFPTSLRHDFEACVEYTAATDGRYLAVETDASLEDVMQPVRSIKVTLLAVAARERPRLDLAALVISEDGSDRYILIFAGLPVSSRDARYVLSDGETMLSGFAVTVDLGAEQPIVKFTALTAGSSVMDWLRFHYEQAELLLAPNDS